MAQSSLVPRKPYFSDPAKAKAAGSLARKRGGVGEQFRNLRLQQIIELKTRGKSNEELAEYFGCSVATIERDVKKIKHDGLVEKYEARITRRLMPRAIRRVERELDAPDGDLTAAKLVFQHFDKTLEHKQQRELVESTGAEDTLEAWAARWTANQQSPAPSPDPPADAAPVAIDGEVVSQ